MRVLTYRLDALPSEADARRQSLAFAKGLGADTVVVPTNTPLMGLDAVAEATGVTVAVLATPDALATLMPAIRTHSARIGVGIDTGTWLEAGRLPVDALDAIGDRLRYVNVRDRAGLGTSSRNVRVGEGAGKLEAFFDELERRNVRPLSLTLDTTGLSRTGGARRQRSTPSSGPCSRPTVGASPRFRRPDRFAGISTRRPRARR